MEETWIKEPSSFLFFVAFGLLNQCSGSFFGIEAKQPKVLSSSKANIGWVLGDGACPTEWFCLFRRLRSSGCSPGYTT